MASLDSCPFCRGKGIITLQHDSEPSFEVSATCFCQVGVHLPIQPVINRGQDIRGSHPTRLRFDEVDAEPGWRYRSRIKTGPYIAYEVRPNLWVVARRDQVDKGRPAFYGGRVPLICSECHQDIETCGYSCCGWNCKGLR